MERVPDVARPAQTPSFANALLRQVKASLQGRLRSHAVAGADLKQSAPDAKALARELAPMPDVLKQIMLDYAKPRSEKDAHDALLKAWQARNGARDMAILRERTGMQGEKCVIEIQEPRFLPNRSFATDPLLEFLNPAIIESLDQWMDARDGRALDAIELSVSPWDLFESTGTPKVSALLDACMKHSESRLLGIQRGVALLQALACPAVRGLLASSAGRANILAGRFEAVVHACTAWRRDFLPSLSLVKEALNHAAVRAAFVRSLEAGGP